MHETLDLQAALDTAVRAAKRAGTLLMERQRGMLEGIDVGVRTKSDAIDYVTMADAEAQAEVIQEITAAYPLHRFLCEEEGADHLGDSENPYRWIVDPLDGTTPFIHGKPNFGTIIALQHQEKTLLGVIWRPFFDELHTGIRGQGAFVNGKPVTLRPTRAMTDAVLCCNLAHRAQQGSDGVHRVALPYCASIENYGNAAQEFAEVLLGQNDGVFFNGPRLWDVLAGCLLIEEAGGRSRTELTDPNDHRSAVLCAASTAMVFDELEEFVFEKKLA